MQPDARYKLDPLLNSLPPHSIEAEMCVLGSMLLAGISKPAIIAETMGVLIPADFYLPKHSTIYDAITACFESTGTVDLVTLVQRLRERGAMERVGGDEYLVELASGVPTAVNAPHYASIVKGRARLRSLIETSLGAATACYGPSADVGAIIEAAQSAMVAIVEGLSTSEPERIGAVAMRVEADMAAREEGESGGTPTGYTELDTMTAGVMPGEMWVVGARPSMGKTAFAMGIAENMARRGVPVGVLSMEMAKEQVAARSMSSASSVDLWNIRTNRVGDDDRQRLSDAVRQMAEWPLYIDDAPSLSPVALMAKLRRMVDQFGVRVAFVDYLQLMDGGGESIYAAATNNSRALKAMAKRMKVGLVALSQINRDNTKRDHKRPTMSDLRDSGAIEQDADAILLLHREDYYHKDDPQYQPTHEAEIIIDKQRNGPTGVVKLRFHREFCTFHNIHPGDIGL